MSKSKLILGKRVDAGFEYNPKILTPIERALGRATLRLHSFEGYDLWRCYELTYLDLKGIPHAATGTLKVPAQSTYIIESKSLKLYLGSFTQTKFTGLDELAAVIKADLRRKLKCEVEVDLTETSEALQPFAQLADPLSNSEFELIDTKASELEAIRSYIYEPELLLGQHSPQEEGESALCSHLLHTLCPVTGQPDHATVYIRSEGERLDGALMLAYLISLRQYQGFHEQACELIFGDLMTYFKLSKLCVLCCFTRRGGIDINPLRCTLGCSIPILRTFRQ